MEIEYSKLCIRLDELIFRDFYGIATDEELNELEETEKKIEKIEKKCGYPPYKSRWFYYD